MAAALAFLHHVAAFALVAAIVVEFVLIRGTITVESARKILRFDAVYGMSAMAVLAIGLFRVFFFEKGAGYYFQSVPFLAKLALFAVVGLASIKPTLEFLSWRTALKQGQMPAIDPRKLGIIRSILHWELAGVVLILLCAALMARGIGFFG